MNHLFIVSGPSGVGKTSLLKAVAEELDNVWVSVSCTTRPPRAGEEDGKDYYFISEAEFERRCKAGDFLEHAEIFGHYYATSKEMIEQNLQAGKTVILEIDCQGAEQVRQHLQNVSIMIVPPSEEDLYARIHQRGKDDSPTIQRRLKQAADELARQSEFDFIVVNEDFAEAAKCLKAIFQGKAAAHHAPPLSSVLDKG